jgi:hypothetical protein
MLARLLYSLIFGEMLPAVAKQVEDDSDQIRMGLQLSYNVYVV